MVSQAYRFLVVGPEALDHFAAVTFIMRNGEVVQDDRTGLGEQLSQEGRPLGFNVFEVEDLSTFRENKVQYIVYRFSALVLHTVEP